MHASEEKGKERKQTKDDPIGAGKSTTLSKKQKRLDTYIVGFFNLT